MVAWGGSSMRNLQRVLVLQKRSVRVMGVHGMLEYTRDRCMRHTWSAPLGHGGTTNFVHTTLGTTCRPTIQSFTNSNHLMLVQSSLTLSNSQVQEVEEGIKVLAVTRTNGCLSTASLNSCPCKSMNKETTSVWRIIRIYSIALYFIVCKLFWKVIWLYLY